MKLSQLALTAALFASGSVFAAGSLSARLEPSQEKASNTATVKYTLTNTGKSPSTILRWETPLTGVLGEIFHVTINGREAEYVGRHYKWAQPQPYDYIELAPGQSETITVDLSAYYDLSETGVYQISYESKHGESDMDNREKAAGRSADKIVSAPVNVFVEGVPYNPPALPTAWNSAKANASGFTSCTSSNQSSINTAMGTATSYAANSLSYLNAGTRGTRYTTWFGTYSTTRYNSVKSHFSNIDNALRTKPVTFNCSCTDSAYAYVYKNQPYNIFVCNAFWSAPNAGTDSKAGTIVHELSHFTVVADTDDWAYGQTAAKNLARSNTKRAVDNADSHEYFAENTPALN